MSKSPWWYEAKYEELQAKCNIFAGIALTCLLICVMMLIVVGVVLFG